MEHQKIYFKVTGIEYKADGKKVTVTAPYRVWAYFVSDARQKAVQLMTDYRPELNWDLEVDKEPPGKVIVCGRNSNGDIVAKMRLQKLRQ